MLSIAPQIGDVLRNPIFRHVYYEGIDRPHLRTRPLPEGLADNYVCHYTRQIREAYEAAPSTPKEHTLLAAWGSYWRANDLLPSRKSALKWLDEMKRKRTPWVHHRDIPRDHYWREMSRYRFVLNPIGACVQNVRVWEALLVGTIPIGDAASYADVALQAEGLPIVVVEQWSDITEEALERWWGALSPRLRLLRPLLTVDAIHARLISGEPIGHALAVAANGTGSAEGGNAGHAGPKTAAAAAVAAAGRLALARSHRTWQAR
eukprot:5674779-Prymnesium_polylepis.2